MPLRGLWKLTWLELKIFVREPMGFIGSVAIPVLLFVVLSRVPPPGLRQAGSCMTIRAQAVSPRS